MALVAAKKNKNIALKRKGKLKEFWRRYKKNKSAMVGLVLLIFVVFCAIFANVIADSEAVTRHNPEIRRQGPSAEHWFGTDIYGRDIYAAITMSGIQLLTEQPLNYRNKMIVGISLAIGVLSAALSLLLGGVLGAVAAYFGGWVDDIIMRIMDMLMSIPATLLALTLVAALGSSTTNLVIALALSNLPSFARLTRSSMLTVVDSDYVEAAKAYGARHSHIIFKEVMPNAMGPIIVQTTQSVSNMILTASSLSFLGVGVQAPAPEWGAMLAEAREFMRQFPYMIISPGIFIIITALSFNLVGDGFRDALDPRLKD